MTQNNIKPIKTYLRFKKNYPRTIHTIYETQLFRARRYKVAKTCLFINTLTSDYLHRA